jgi:acyl dehydratase
VVRELDHRKSPVSTGRYFDDFTVGEVLVTPARTIGESEVAQFAQLTGDFNPLHTDAVFAGASHFGGRVAHGLLGLSLVPGLLSRLGDFDGTAIAALGVENWRYLAPIFIGDTVHVEVTVAALTPTSDGARGVVVRDVEILNQRGDTVQRGRLPILMKKRP